MKKTIFIILFCFSSLFLLAELKLKDMYFDAGLGMGLGITKLNGKANANSAFKHDGITTRFDGAYSVSLRGGYEVQNYDGMPLYGIIDFTYYFHHFIREQHRTGLEDRTFHDMYNSSVIGLGAVFYPVEFFQLSASLGPSLATTANNRDGYQTNMGWGYGYNLTAAADIPIKKFIKENPPKGSVLIGVNLFASYNTLDKMYELHDDGNGGWTETLINKDDRKYDSLLFSLFFKYRFL